MEENYITQETQEVIARLTPYLSLQGLKAGFTQERYLAKEAFEVDLSHAYLKEMSAFFHEGNQLVIPALIDMVPLFDALDKGAVLSPVELFNIADLLSESESLADLLDDKKEYEHLFDDAQQLDPVEGLKRELRMDLEPDYTVSDNASAKLRDIRSRKHALEHSLASVMESYRNRYSQYLTSDTVNFKNGEETLPVKVQYKNMVKGTILSYSQTGETAFMVPYEMLDLRNKLRETTEEENSEIMSILADLSGRCQKALKSLKQDYQIIETFDRYQAAVHFGDSYQGCIADHNEGYLTLNGLFHPLLKASTVVSNSISLGKDNPRSLVITGPNAGGKSVLIKAVALAVRMDQLGLFVPCHISASLPFIDTVFFLGGDNQSVLDNLSTFSSSLVGLKHITETATPASLVIIDEIGEGTSPKDGEALAVALLKYFEKLDCFTILTSHFDGLKFYAAKDDKTMTGAMEFNTEGLKPTYRLLLHTTGKSYGILLAKNLGLKPEIIKDAQEFEESRSNQDVDSLMEKLTEQESQNDKIRRELENKKKDLDKVIAKREAAIASLNEEKSSIHQKAQEKVERLVDQRLAEMDAIWKSKAAEANYSEFSKAKGEMAKIKTEPSAILNDAPKEVLPTLAVGDWVEDEDGRRSQVLEVKKNEVALDLNGLRFQRPIRGLKKAHLQAHDLKKPKSDGTDYIEMTLGSSQGLELNIIGLYVDDAMREVVSFIDNARVRKLSSVRIIHGLGSFALKNALWKYLANHPSFVKDYRLGGEGKGGMGATVIHLIV